VSLLSTSPADHVVGHQDSTSQIAGQLALILASIEELGRRMDGRVKSHYTVEEVAELTGRAAYTVRAWVRDGRLAAIRVPGSGPKGRLLVPHDELRRLVTDGRAGQIPALVVDLPTLADAVEGCGRFPRPGSSRPRSGGAQPADQ
jgi:excisionase family DNA binding protein